MINKHQYRPENIYNMDETGYGIGLSQSTWVLVVREDRNKKEKKATKASTGRQEWVTSIEGVSASGRSLPPLVIFTAEGSLNSRWLPDKLEVQGWRWATSNKGWSNNTLAFEWLERVFEPCTAHPPSSSSNTRRLLILDGHGSHITGRFITFCIDHAIDLMVLPAHTSQVSQPLDVGIFGPLKRQLARLIDGLTTYDPRTSGRLMWRLCALWL